MANKITISVKNNFDYSGDKIKISGINNETKEKVDLECLPTQECTTVLTKENAGKTKVETTFFKLTDIPSVMKKNGWEKAAYLNNKWLYGKPIEMKVKEKRDFVNARDELYLYKPNYFNHDWLVSFSRYKEALQDLEKNIISSGTKNIIVKYLNREKAFKNRIFKGESNYLNINSVADLKELHRDWQFQRQPIDSSTIDKVNTYYDNGSKIDDLWATFGSFSVYAAIGQYTVVPEPEKSQYVVYIDSIVCYAIDSYDFIVTEDSDDYLGHWNKEKMDFYKYDYLKSLLGSNEDKVYGVNLKTPQRGRTIGNFTANDLLFSVYNRHYKAYRNKKKHGRDMIVWTEPKLVNIRGLGMGKGDGNGPRSFIVKS